MKIDNAQLAAFAAVIREGSFDAAARALHVTPSAVSQRIRQLEERLGQVLVRRGSPCQPTAAGRLLVRHTQELALLEAEMLGALGGAEAAVSGERPVMRLPVAVNADSLETWFLAVMAALPADAGVLFDLRVEDQDHSATLLRDGTVMAAVSASAAPVQGCRVEPLGVMRYLAVAAPGFAARHFPRGVNSRSLARAPMLRFNAKDALQHQFIALRTAEPLTPPTHFVPSVHGFLGLTIGGLGWGMVPEVMARPAIVTGELVELVRGKHLDVPLYWHRWRLESQALATLTAAVVRGAKASLRPLPNGA
jgi:LysR family transcriptional regulator, chromosome initiation inhibitor